MKHLTKSISIIALAAGLVTFGPNQIPTSANGWSFTAKAEAANIKRTRIKQRRNGLYKTTIVTQTNSNDTAEAASLELQYDDGSSAVLFSPNSMTVTYIVQNSPVAIPPFMKYLRRSKTTEARMNLSTRPPAGNSDSSEDAATGRYFAEDGSDGFDGAITATTKLNSKGHLVIKLTGPVEAMAEFNAAEPIELSIGFDGKEIAAKYRNTQREWTCEDSCQPEGEPGSVVITAYDSKGAALDSSSVEVQPETVSPVDATDFSPSFGRNFISQSKAGNLFLASSVNIPRQPGDTIRDDLIMDLTLMDDETGIALIEAKDIAPKSRETRAVWKNIEAADSGNVVDREYMVNFLAYAPKSDVPEEISIRVRADEFGGKNLTVNVFEDNVMLLGVGFGQNDDGESYTLRAVASRADGGSIIFEEPFEGPAPLTTIFVLDSVVSDDGGSDIEPEFLKLDASDEQLFFTIEGNKGTGSLSGDGGSFTLTKTLDCCDGDSNFGWLEITRGVVGNGISAKPFGFGSGTKKSTRSANSRAELQ